ncbi:MAG: PPK2 family polyphosphate kinase [Mycobacteriales bacterium]
MTPSQSSVRDLLKVPSGPVTLTDYDARATPGAPGRRKRTSKALVEAGPRLAELQERLYAGGHVAEGEPSPRRLLVVLQGMDTSGKDGTISHVLGAVNPLGCSITAFKKPTPTERRHHFLWRIRRHLPSPGMLGIFNRSHYEDVLVARVHELAGKPEIEKRYGEINDFEQELVSEGVTLVKVFLHLSPEEQRERLLARLADPSKHWKFNAADVSERRLWSEYQSAYEIVLERCNTAGAPWFLVPADRKWYRNWAVGALLVETLAELDPRYPQPDLDVAALTRALEAG